MTVALRPARESDLSAINDIYNHYVVHSTCTYQEEPEPLSGRERWFGEHGPTHPVIIAERRNEVVGWGCISPYHRRSAYRKTVEDTVYVHPDWQHRGIGSLILGDLVSRSRTIGHRAMIAVIDSEQEASVSLHAKYGFRQAGRLKEVGFKFGRFLDVVYMELLL